MTKTAVYPGSFDPITNGHIDIIKRSIKIFDKLIIGVAEDNAKQSTFNVSERVELIKSVINELGLADKVEVQGFSGLLVNMAHKNNASVIIRGLRAVADFEFEFQLAVMNYKIADDVETLFLMASDTQQFVSSRFVKEIHRLGGNVDQFLSPVVVKAMDDKRG
ncbi:MAG: pantetheine-phosphate adenylyltransferase [Alphaproteobacteria bacterium]